MAARVTMELIIAKVRRMIGDTGVEAIFTDDEIQETLDIRRRRITDRRIWGDPYRTVDSLTYTTFQTNLPGMWESQVVRDSAFTDVTGVTFNESTGEITLDDPRLTNDLYLSGYVYDVNGSAADLLEEWMAKIKQDYSFTRGQRSFQRGEQRQNFVELIERYRSAQWIITSQLVRTDERW